jgi:UDP-N-acetylglucosamine acyltransferase
MRSVHATAIVDPRAELQDDVVVGPYAIVEGPVSLGPRCVLHAHAIVRGPAILGAGNVVHSFAVVGGEPQAKKHDGGPARFEAGHSNVFREHVTLHGGTEGRATRVGDANLFMVGSHVAHDCHVGSSCVLANGVQLAGHAFLEDWVTLGGLSGVAQFVRIGEGAFVAAMSACERDVPPFVIAQGDRARVRGINVVGLRRRSVPEESIAALERAARSLWLSKQTRADALSALRDEKDPYVRRLVGALAGGSAGPGA